MPGYRNDAWLRGVSEVPVRAGRPLKTPAIGFQQPDDFLDFEGHAGTVTMSYDIEPYRDGKRAAGAAGLGGDGFAAAPHAAGGQAVVPGEGALVVGVPQDDVGQAAADHGAAVRGAQRVGTAQGGGT